VYFKQSPIVTGTNAQATGGNHSIASCVADATIVKLYHISSFVSHEMIAENILLINIL